ncbi:MAG: hypothetical protein ACJ8FY_26835 [Gemmataceae bacterium]
MADQTLVRREPRISVNKLGEYMAASAMRRRRIVREQKTPPQFMVARYTEANEAITSFLASGARDDGILLKTIERLNDAEPKSEWDAQRLELCIEALENMLEIEDYSFLEGACGEPARSDAPKLDIAGVAISVRPEVILNVPDGATNRTVGAVKLYLGKTIPLTEEAGAYVGTLVQLYVVEALHAGEAADFKKCGVLDVFAQRFHAAPRAYITRRREIEAACQEISRAWAAV